MIDPQMHLKDTWDGFVEADASEIDGHIIHQDFDPVAMRLSELFTIGRVDVIGRAKAFRIHALNQEKHDPPVSLRDQALQL